jgi:glycosyltransferase involved in cell wall biosynthesis
MTATREFAENKLSILHIVGSVGRLSGGLGPVALGLARQQLDAGNRVAIWTLDSPTELQTIAVENKLARSQNCRLVGYPTVGPKRIGLSPAMEQAAISRRGEFYMILHQHNLWMANSRVTNRWRKTFERPTVIAPHGTLEKYALKRSAWKKKLATLAYESENLCQASCLHATSVSEALSFRRYGLRNPIAIIPNGVSETWINSVGDANHLRSRLALTPDRRLLLFISRIHPQKGLPFLFEAMSLIRQELADWCFVIAGPDEAGHRRELESLAQRLHLENMIKFIGPVSGDDKRDAFAAADLFILPTHSENFSIVVAEALGAGIPVITTRGAPWEELQTHDCGWWVDINVGAIKNALLEAIHRPPAELKEMGKRGKALVTDKYTWAQLAQKSIRLYDWLLGRAERPDFVVLD